MVKYCLEDFFRSKLPTHVFAKDCFLTAQGQACKRFTWLFVFWVFSQCRLPVTKNTLETLTKSSSSSCGNNWSQIFFSFCNAPSPRASQRATEHGCYCSFRSSTQRLSTASIFGEEDVFKMFFHLEAHLAHLSMHLVARERDNAAIDSQHRGK